MKRAIIKLGHYVCGVGNSDQEILDKLNEPYPNGKNKDIVEAIPEYYPGQFNDGTIVRANVTDRLAELFNNDLNDPLLKHFEYFHDLGGFHIVIV